MVCLIRSWRISSQARSRCATSEACFRNRGPVVPGGIAMTGGSQMTQSTATFAPKRTARIAGVLFLLTILTGVFAQFFVSDRLVVWGDAAATATNILRSRSLYQWSFTIYMLEMAFQVATTALFYLLLRPVNRSVALIALCLGLLGCV